jgi:hypothetical protein
MDHRSAIEKLEGVREIETSLLQDSLASPRSIEIPQRQPNTCIHVLQSHLYPREPCAVEGLLGFVMDKDHLMPAARTMPLNPVRARLVERAVGSAATNARAHLEGAATVRVEVTPLLARAANRPADPDLNRDRSGRRADQRPCRTDRGGARPKALGHLSARRSPGAGVGRVGLARTGKRRLSRRTRIAVVDRTAGRSRIAGVQGPA